MSQAYCLVRQNLRKSTERQKRLYDTNTQTQSFQHGDWVWVVYPPEVKKKFGQGWNGPYLVINRLGSVNYRVQKSESSVVTVHVDHMKVYEHTDIPDIWISTHEGIDVGVPVELREI